MPLGGMRDLSHQYLISELLLRGSIRASGALSQIIGVRVLREKMGHLLSGWKPRSKRIQGDPRNSRPKILAVCPYFPSTILWPLLKSPRQWQGHPYFDTTLSLACYPNGCKILLQIWKALGLESGDAARRCDRPYIPLFNFGAAPLFNHLSLRGTLVNEDRVGREKMHHFWSGFKLRSKRIQGDPRNPILEMLIICLHNLFHSLGGRG
jgi:hypothetical protein